jgi:hypothetical protein
VAGYRHSLTPVSDTSVLDRVSRESGGGGQRVQHAISFDANRSCASIKVIGAVKGDDVVDLARSLLAHPDWHGAANVLVDYRESDFTELSKIEMERISKSIVEIANEFGGARAAIVVSREVDFGIVRMWEMSTGDAILFAFRVFRSIDEARAWIDAESSPS